MYNIIAIDGTSGSGKGTIAKEVARRLNYTYIDTGAMYRCVALKSLEDNISLNEEDKIDVQEVLTEFWNEKKSYFFVFLHPN